jgi:threonine dehydrogenase-like Zn-dependent dehydrogenase
MQRAVLGWTVVWKRLAIRHTINTVKHPELVMDNLVSVVRATGRIGVVGVYAPEDPGAATDGAKQGRIGFNFGALFEKGIPKRMRTSTNVKQAGPKSF